LTVKTNEYISKVILFIEILSNKALDSFSCGGTEKEDITQYWMWDENGIMDNAEDSSFCFKITSTILDFNDYLSKEIISRAIEYSNKDLKPAAAYLFIRDAIFHYNNKEYRRSILDASTAIEIALTERLLEEFSNRNIKDKKFINSLLKKYHSLGGRIDLIIALDIGLPRSPSEYTNFLSRIRNRAIHGGYKSDRIEAKKVIDIARATVEKYCKIAN
jgi:hypothetical protein